MADTETFSAAERQRVLAAAVESSEDFVALADDEMRIVHVNAAGLALIGLTGPGAVLHRPISQLVVPADYARLGEEMLAALASTDHWRGEVRLAEWTSREPVLTEMHAFVVRRPNGGARTGFAIVARDIRERRRAEEAVRRHEALLSGIIGSAMDAIISVDSARRIVVFNHAAEAMFRCSAAEATGTPIERFVGGLPHCSDRLTVRRADGSDFPAEVTVSWVDVGQERIATVILRDLTERLRLEEQLRQASKMEAVGQLAGGVAHDFNNLLTVITAYSGLLLETVGVTSNIAGELNEIVSAAKRAASLTRQLLAFSRKQLLQPRLLDINVVVTGLESMLGRLIGEDIEIVLELDPTVGRVRADPGQLEQVLVNLAVNARDAMPAGGVLRIETMTIRVGPYDTPPHPSVRPGAFVALEVRDTGIGMDEATQKRVFEPFFTTKDPGRGTGLGLATVYGIVQQSGGHVWAQSRPGHGSAFLLLLPEVADVDSAVEEPLVDTPARGGTETVLVAEDDPAVRELIRGLLMANGYTVLDASNGAEALLVAAATDGEIDLLVTDVVMPTLGGRALAERLRLARPHIRVLFATGYAGDEVGRRGGLDPNAILLQKPFTAEQLAVAVRRALDAPVVGGLPRA